METIQEARTSPPWRAAPRAHDDDHVNDAELLELFISHQDEWAFAELVRRHGPMVLGVCQRVLHNPHDAEDCFQAAFMVLVRKATSIQPRAMVGNWLYGVAYRTALEARKMAARRRVMERKKHQSVSSEVTPDSSWQELRPVLDQELSRLPDKYRVVLVACDLQDKTRQQAAQELGLPEGTVASRLARGRTLLAKRLTRHNLALSTATLALVLTENAVTAAVPTSLAASTAAAALELAAGRGIAGGISPKVAALTDCVVKGLFWTKLKIATAALVVLAALGLGIGAFLPAAGAEVNPHDPKAAAQPRKVKPDYVFGYVLQKVDPSSNTIEAIALDPTGSTSHSGFLELGVDPSTAITIADQGGKITDLRNGLIVDLEIERSAVGKHKAVRIKVTGESIAGVILSLDTERDIVTIASNVHGDIVKKTYELEKTAVLYIDGKKTKLGKLSVKMKVTLQVAFKKPSVVGIQASGPKVVGIVTAIDARKRLIAVNVQNTGQDADEIGIAPDAVVFIDGKQGNLADLKTGMQVTLQMSAEDEKKQVVNIATAIGTKKP